MPLYTIGTGIALFKSPAAAAAGSYDSDTTAWVNAVVADGGAVSTPEKDDVDALIVGLKADSVWTLLDRLWLLAGSDIHQAKIDVRNLQSLTVTGSPTFSANHGYTGGSTSNYLDTNFNVRTASSPQFVRDSAHLSAYVQTTTGGTSTGVAIGNGVDQNGGSRIYGNFSGNTYFAINNATFTASENPANGTGNGKGFFLISRTGASATQAYKNGSTFGAGGSTSSSAYDGTLTTITVLVDNRVGGISDPCPDQVSCVTIGAGLNGTQAANLMTRINTWHTAANRGVAINIY